MTVPEAVFQGVAAFQTHPQADDDVIAQHLSAGGLDDESAVTLIQFIPIAFCRFVFRGSGIQFAPTYVVMDTRGKAVGEHLLEDEPVFRETLALCEAARAEGRGSDFFLPIAARSAGYQVIQELLQKGSQPENIITSPPILQAWTPPKKKWWQRN